MAKRERTDPAAFMRISPEEAARRAAEEEERVRRIEEEAARPLAQRSAKEAGSAEKASRIKERAARVPRRGEAVLVATADQPPGLELTEVLGAVYGIVVNSRGPLSDTAAKVRTAVGGEVRSYLKLMSEVRAEAIERLKDEASDLGADAVVAMRFDTTAITDEMVEVVAYGTAVAVRHNGDPQA